MSLLSNNKYEEKRLKKSEKMENKELNYKRKTLASEMTFQEKLMKIKVNLSKLEEDFAAIVDTERRRINYYSEEEPDYDLSAAYTRLRNAFYAYKLVHRQQMRMEEVQGNRQLRVALNDMSRTLGFINRMNDASGPIKDLIFKIRLKLNDSSITKMSNPSAGVGNSIENSLSKNPSEYLVSDEVVKQLLDGDDIDEIKKGYCKLNDSINANIEYDTEHGIGTLIDDSSDDNISQTELDKFNAFLDHEEHETDDWFNN
ncbi:MAG: hypothetical protein IK093_11805 [Ruminiclostridium sp.]|nr:hypothetical protein [Ruminiclostridium sp.]